jgi:hypothetical protein
MSGHRKWSEVRANRERRREGTAPVSSAPAELQKKLKDHVKTLAGLRRARLLTQKQLGKLMMVSQAQVSRVENQTDLYLSTLRDYVAAMGGELQIRVAFPDTGWTEVAVGDVTQTEEHVVEHRESLPDVSVVRLYGQPENLTAATIWSSSALAKIGPSPFDTPVNSWVACTLNSRINYNTHAIRATWERILRGHHEAQPHSEPARLLVWQTKHDPFYVPDDSERFVSSAEIREP